MMLVATLAIPLVEHVVVVVKKDTLQKIVLNPVCSLERVSIVVKRAIPRLKYVELDLYTQSYLLTLSSAPIPAKLLVHAMSVKRRVIKLLNVQSAFARTALALVMMLLSARRTAPSTYLTSPTRSLPKLGAIFR